MLKPWEIIRELEADNSRLAKEEIILREAEAGNTEFFRGVRGALDSMITFGVKQVPEAVKDGRGLSFDTFQATAEQLARRELTGDAARVAIAHMMQKATQEEWNLWYRRILIKDLRCGVSEKTVNKMVEKCNAKDYAVSVFSVQLAHDSANHESKISGPKLIEIKLDGVRVAAIVYPNGTVDLFSRNGKQLANFPLVEQQLSRHARFLKEPMVFDGEIMSSSFQDLMKQVHRKDNVKSNDAVLNLFDMLPLSEFRAGQSVLTQAARSQQLAGWHSLYAEHMPNITVVGQELVDLDTAAGQTRFAEINRQAIAGGYEGVMLKDPRAKYECKRTVAWLKMKPFIEVSLTVETLEEGTGKNAGRLGALVCFGVDDDREIRVNVGSGLTDLQREEIWQDKKAVLGQTVEVRADAVTQNQDGTYSLRFPRFKGFRGFVAGEKL